MQIKSVSNSKSCMICPMVPFSLTSNDPSPRFQGHGVLFRPMNALYVLCVQLTRDLFVIAKFLATMVKFCVRVRTFNYWTPYPMPNFVKKSRLRGLASWGQFFSKKFLILAGLSPHF